MVKKLLLSLFILNSFAILAQNDCATDYFFQKQMEDNDFRTLYENIERQIYEQSVEGTYTRNDDGSVYTIPVVVHVMHKGEAVGTGSNISEAIIIRGLNHLNKAFSNTGASFSSNPDNTNAGINGVDVGIQFCLAKQDPNGNATNGINRKQSTYSDLKYQETCGSGTQDNCIKAESFWDANKYLNVWLVNSICAKTGESCGIAGYATLAPAHGSATDGIVVEAKYWGSNADNSKIHVHEVGHYFSLFHTFEGGCSETNCYTGGDRVCDTPPDSSTAAKRCDLDERANTCSNDSTSVNSVFTTDVEDMYENYMDYGFQWCQNTFTQGQKDRMRMALTNVRSSLISSDGCKAIDIAPTSTFKATKTKVCLNDPVQFFDTSDGQATSWLWEFPGGTPATSTEKNPTVRYASPGEYSVTLKITNQYGENTSTTTNYISVTDFDRVFKPAIKNTGTSNYFTTGITHVKLEQIDSQTNNTRDSYTAYEDFSCTNVAYLTIGNEYTLTVAAGGLNKEGVKAWIDFNGNQSFEDSEVVYDFNDLSGIEVNRTFTVPASTAITSNANIAALAGPTVTDQRLLMRVVSDLTGITREADKTPAYGQIEDYAVIIQSTTALPLDWVSTDILQVHNGLKLTWETANEINNDRFLIQKMINDKFETIDIVLPNNEAYNSYSYTDAQVLPNQEYYYRIKQVDTDGKFSYSDVITGTFEKENSQLSIYPNPTSGQFSIIGISAEQIKSISVVNLLGQVIDSSGGSNSIDLSNYNNGVYIVLIEQTDGQSKSLKILKQ